MIGSRAGRLAAAAMVSACLCGPVAAHNPSVAQVHLAPDPRDGRSLAIEIDLSLKDLALTVPLDADRDEAVTWGELLGARADIEALVDAGFTVAVSGRPCTITPVGLATRRYDDGMYATLQLAADCPAAGPFDVRYRVFRDRDPQHRAMVTFADDDRATVDIARGDAAVRVGIPTGGEAGADRGLRTFVPFVREGIHHILVGYDHIAFLLSLVLPALLVWTGRAWQAAARLRPQLAQVFWVVTAFTVAHSATLTLAALGWVVPVSRWVEVAIAASVVLAALNNLRPVVTRRVWVLSLGFGLVHGFGFAGALAEMGLPRDARFAALLGFNVGVELGQLLLLAVLLPALVLTRRAAWYPRVVLPGVSVAIACLAGGWLVQRLAG